MNDDLALEGRENLARQKRFLLAMSVVVAAFLSWAPARAAAGGRESPSISIS